ncbi:MAG: helix-turn-helix transcriptional regulator [Bacillota bacterium]|nr:helix-turn-helix transcriptional regulator [Bacillota bacterium]
MEDLKYIIAKNIVDLRKSMNLTQAELGEKLNYSDKAVSKWERAESIPDVFTLKEIVDIFGVTMDYLLESEHKESEKNCPTISKQKKRNRLIITLLSTSLIFLIATFTFVFLGLYFNKSHQNLWMIYIYTIPLVCIVLLVFNSIWGKRKLNFLIISLLVWSILLCVYLSFISYDIWLIFTIGVPAQIIIFLWGKMKLDFN